MRFDALDKRLRVYETAHDFCVPPNIYMVARLDGRGFTKLTKERHAFERPFDERFRDAMVATLRHLMGCGFKVVYGYTESDEISLLFDFEETLFSRKLRKYNSVLAGEASARFSLLLGDVGVFDCRIAQLPRKQDVLDYFRWRSEDAFRNALNAHCYWLLRKQGQSAKAATRAIEGKSTGFKNELLFGHGINFNELPAWQKRGVGCFWGSSEKKGWNPQQQKEVPVQRRELKVAMELPIGEAYADFVSDVMENKDA